MNERLQGYKNLIYDAGEAVYTFVNTYNEQLALAGAAALLVTATWILVREYYKTAGERRMKRAAKLEKDRIVADSVTDLLLKLNMDGRLNTADVQHYSKVMGINGDIRDLIPRPSQEAVKKAIKRRLYSNKPEVNITDPNRKYVQHDPVVFVDTPPPLPKKEPFWKRIRLARPFTISP